MEKRVIAKLSASVVAVGLATCAMTGVFGGGEITYREPAVVTEAPAAVKPAAEKETPQSVPAPADPLRMMRKRPVIPGDPSRMMRQRPDIPAETVQPEAPADASRMMRKRPVIPGDPFRMMRQRPDIPAETVQPEAPADASRMMRERPAMPD